MGSGTEVKRINRELPITYAVIEWLDQDGWPLIFPEVTLPRGLVRGRVDVAAVSKQFKRTVAVEVKALYHQDDTENQIFDAQRAAELVFLAAPQNVLKRVEVPSRIGILEADVGSAPVRLTLVRRAIPGSPEFGCRKEFLHALMRSALRRGRIDPTWIRGSCPACLSAGCPLWYAPPEAEVVLDESLESG